MSDWGERVFCMRRGKTETAKNGEKALSVVDVSRKLLEGGNTEDLPPSVDN